MTLTFTARPLRLATPTFEVVEGCELFPVGDIVEMKVRLKEYRKLSGGMVEMGSVAVFKSPSSGKELEAGAEMRREGDLWRFNLTDETQSLTVMR